MSTACPAAAASFAMRGRPRSSPRVGTHIPAGTFHSRECDAPQPLDLLCLFTSPVILGSYEKGKKP